ncbi:MAG: 2-hydroxyacyl-CoA dehydratase [Clostridiales bacterium]|nr:2-hydroxyacyl-CoA dehydratase [Clostridiales bacterium]
MESSYSIGIDIGSTTAKVVAVNKEGTIVYGKYQRHFADIKNTVKSMLEEVYAQIGNRRCTIAVTGSGGLALAKYMHVEFTQEVIAVTSAVQATVPDADVVIELGGEDAKIIFLKNGVDQRMNGICAGGTGAFIDQMASLLQTDAAGLNTYAASYTEIYPIAARCGVFAKSDIQPLINDGVSRENLAASIFQAVVNQTISGLACGRKIEGKVVFLGGPLHFLPELRSAFIRTLSLTEENAVLPESAHLFAAMGAAAAGVKGKPVLLADLVGMLQAEGTITSEMNHLEPLFSSEEEYEIFKKRQSQYTVPKGLIDGYEGNCYLGIDAGSTTMKLAVVSEDGKLLYSYYGSNRGNPLMVAKDALLDLFGHMGPKAKIAYSCSTGYGEDLLKHAFHLDEGEVETITHYCAARYFEPDVDCILDIGGQDMKCITIKNGSVDSIILNEACSSGCGSFIENFANSLGCTAEEFAAKAVAATDPVDLGTRCTVFMNSNVKQAQKEGAKVEDIAAGLAYSVIKNALYKVIKLKDVSVLGEKFVVQGGTFYNDAVLRCFELTAGHEAIRPDIAGLMGAFGAALLAKERCQGQPSSILSEAEIAAFSYEKQTMHCHGCSNRCRLTVNVFPDGARYISGNRCEKGLQNKETINQAPNLFEYKRRRLFSYDTLTKEEAYRGTIGIPRVLNLYEDYPFWAVFFKQLGFRTILSPYSDRAVFRMGMDSIPSESECYPAKLAHGHIEWLARHGVDTIFYPCVYYERKEREAQQNSFNCPMVISYPENIRNNVDSLGEKNIRYLNPFLSFADEEILTKNLCEFMKKEYHIGKSEVEKAAHLAWEEQLHYKEDVLEEGRKALRWMEENHASGIVLAGRPYHLDPEINHGIPEMIHSFGLAVFTEDSVADLSNRNLVLRATNQWTYHSRLYAAAEFVSHRKDLELVQLNSFGCGLDAITIDQVQDLLAQAGRMYTLLKIDEISNLGAARIRVRSLLAAMKMRKENPESGKEHRIKDFHRPEFTQEMHDEKYTILCTDMVPYHFELMEAAMRASGYHFVMLREENQRSIDLGLKYVNNDACYPAIITTGQILDAVTSGKYDPHRLAVVMAQTGGGCRASNYVGFIRKALKEAGYEYIPVISANMNGMEKNPGFHYSVKMGIRMLQALIYGDTLMRVLHRVRPYEKVGGSADQLYDKWQKICTDDLLKPSITRGWSFYRNCRDIIKEFDRLPLKDQPPKPKVGIVGEVLVKYMPLANNHLIGLLEEEGAEVVVPDFIDFMEYVFWNAVYRKKYLGGSQLAAVIANAAALIMDVSRKPVYRALNHSEHFRESASFKEIRRNAQQILSLGNQCGEGWFLGGEIIDLIHRKVNNVVCAQPFGCLPNHIVGKGIMKRLKEFYPQANIVPIDYDPSASRVNQLNRIKLMMEVAKEKNCVE